MVEGSLMALPESFSGTGKSLALEDFLFDVESFVKLHTSRFESEEVVVTFVGSLLTGEARRWFRMLARTSPISVATYAVFATAIRKEFGPYFDVFQTRLQLLALRQQDGTIMQYTQRFRSLHLAAGFNEEASTVCYFNGLSPRFQNHLSSLAALPKLLDEMIECCLGFGARHSSPTENSSNSFHAMEIDAIQVARQERKERLYCYDCRRPGHETTACTKNGLHQ